MCARVVVVVVVVVVVGVTWCDWVVAVKKYKLPTTSKGHFYYDFYN